jgi:hypothetical protein
MIGTQQRIRMEVDVEASYHVSPSLSGIPFRTSLFEMLSGDSMISYLLVAVPAGALNKAQP